MSTAEVRDVLATQLASQPKKAKLKNRPAFLPPASWPLYTYSQPRKPSTTRCSITDLRLGDCICLGKGDVVPATLRLLTVRSLVVHEEHITGYAAPAHKQTFASKSVLPLTQQKNMVFAGSTILSGQATGVVVELAQAANLPKATNLKQNLPGFAIQSTAVKHIAEVNIVVFDDLQRFEEVTQLIQELYLEKNIRVVFFVRAYVADRLRQHLPANVFTDKIDNYGGAFVMTNPSPAQKTRVVRAAQAAGLTCAYVGRGEFVEPVSRIVNLNIVTAARSTQAALRGADIVLTKASIPQLSSIFYNKK